MTLVRSVSRELTMPECGDDCDLRGRRYVCVNADYSSPGYAKLTFVVAEPKPQTAVLPAPMPETDSIVIDNRSTARDIGGGTICIRLGEPQRGFIQATVGAKTLAGMLPESELRAECERRGFGPTVTQEAMHLMLVAERNNGEHWKTVAESAAAERDALRAMAKVSQTFRERGPGIAATKPDTSAYFDERDLLADDA